MTGSLNSRLYNWYVQRASSTRKFTAPHQA